MSVAYVPEISLWFPRWVLEQEGGPNRLRRRRRFAMAVRDFAHAVRPGGVDRVGNASAAQCYGALSSGARCPPYQLRGHIICRRGGPPLLRPSAPPSSSCLLRPLWLP